MDETYEVIRRFIEKNAIYKSAEDTVCPVELTNTLLKDFFKLSKEQITRSLKVQSLGIDFAKELEIEVDMDVLSFILLFYNIGSTISPIQRGVAGKAYFEALGLSTDISNIFLLYHNPKLSQKMGILPSPDYEVYLDILKYSSRNLDKNGDSLTPLENVQNINKLFHHRNSDTRRVLTDFNNSNEILIKYIEQFIQKITPKK